MTTNDQVTTLREALAEAACKFRYYETQHRAKNTEDSLAKAVVNADLASRLEAILVATEHAATQQAEPRYYMDHGLLHDRETGQHMWTQDQYDERYRDGLATGDERTEARLAATQPAGDGCKLCLGAKGGVPGNANVIGGVVVCDYCTSTLMDMKAAGWFAAPISEDTATEIAGLGRVTNEDDGYLTLQFVDEDAAQAFMHTYSPSVDVRDMPPIRDNNDARTQASVGSETKGEAVADPELREKLTRAIEWADEFGGGNVATSIILGALVSTGRRIAAAPERSGKAADETSVRTVCGSGFTPPRAHYGPLEYKQANDDFLSRPHAPAGNSSAAPSEHVSAFERLDPANPYKNGLPAENWQRGYHGARFIGYKGSIAEKFFNEGVAARAALAAPAPTGESVSVPVETIPYLTGREIQGRMDLDQEKFVKFSYVVKYLAAKESA